MTKREKQRLQNLQEKIAEMNAQKNAIISRETKRQRKENSRRLIQIGKIAEQHLNCVGIARTILKKSCNSFLPCRALASLSRT